MSDSKSKRALVLGCGGVAGAAWLTATLAELERVLSWDARKSDLTIGTSAGALMAALLSRGVSVSRMAKSQAGELRDDCWNHDRDWGAPFPPLPALRLTAPKLLLGVATGKLDLMAAASGLLPAGRADLSSFERLLDTVSRDGAPVHPATWLMAVDTQSGERVAFGRDGAPPMSTARAVCASYAVPGWCPPVHDRGKSYVDGGIVSPTSADFLLGTGVREAIVLAPMASSAPDQPRSLFTRMERLMRTHMTRVVDREVAQLRSAGIRVVRIEPGAEDLRAFGPNLMDPKRRKRVFETALRTAPSTVSQALAAAH